MLALLKFWSCAALCSPGLGEAWPLRFSPPPGRFQCSPAVISRMLVSLRAGPASSELVGGVGLGL